MIEKPGIYVIINTLNNKKYIGSTKYLQRRWSDHKWLLRLNKHTNSHLQASYNQHGAEVFHFRPLEECAIEQLTTREEAWIQELETLNPEKGYNIKSPAAEETMHDRNPPKSSQVGSHIDIYNKETLELLYTLTINAAESTTGVPKNKIWDVVAGRRASAKGFIFRRRGEPIPQQIKVGGYKQPRQVSVDGTTFPSVAKAAEALGVKPGSIYDWIRLKRHAAHYPL